MSYETRVNHPSRTASAAPVAFLTALFTSLVVTVAVLALTGNLKLPGTGEAAKPAPVVRKVPSVIGITPEVAGDVIRARELRLLVRGEREDSKMAKGKIVEQDPMAGSDLELGGAVKVTVSLGPKTIAVPPVIGKPTEEAKQLITDKGLTLGEIAQTGEEAPPGTVTDTNPKPGTEIAEGQAVSLVVTPDGIVVPDVVGKYVGGAKKVLEEAGLQRGTITWRYNEYRDENVVLSQEPAAGATAPPGSAVNLVVNEED